MASACPPIWRQEIYGFLLSVLEFATVSGVDKPSGPESQYLLELLGFRAGRILGDQVRGACPIHGSTSRRSRSFSATLRKNTYQCFKCGSAGTQLDLWAAATYQSIYDAAVDLCGKLHVEVPL